MQAFETVSRIPLVLSLFALQTVSGLTGPEIASPSPEGKTTVVLVGIQFQPERIGLEVGDTLEFVNKDRFEHNVYIVRTANPNVVLVPAEPVPAGGSVQMVVTEKGLYTVYCTIHGGMTARLSTTGTFELTEAEKREAGKLAPSLPPIVKTGEKLFWGEAQCYRCHSIGDLGEAIRGPNLRDIGFRSRFQAKEAGVASGTEYLVQAILSPESYVVPGYSRDMPKVYEPPMGLREEPIKAVIAYLQSQGGKVDTWAVDIDRRQLQVQPVFNPFQSGDPKRGGAAFKEVGCANCHAVGSERGGVGPELTAIGAYRNWQWLAESILDPDAEIGQEWTGATVYPYWGETVSGMLRANTDSVVTLMITADEFETIPRDEIERVQISETSSMPRNYGDILSFRQIADIVVYLESLKGEGK
ncbi:MAG: c-type cytochrome [Fidelibacterota bacterium]